jgi:hypothetical protein
MLGDAGTPSAPPPFMPAGRRMAAAMWCAPSPAAATGGRMWHVAVEMAEAREMGMRQRPFPWRYCMAVPMSSSISLATCCSVIASPSLPGAAPPPRPCTHRWSQSERRPARSGDGGRVRRGGQPRHFAVRHAGHCGVAVAISCGAEKFVHIPLIPSGAGKVEGTETSLTVHIPPLRVREKLKVEREAACHLRGHVGHERRDGSGAT